MTLPFTFPDWMPWWLQLAVTVAAILLVVALALMPFSVFGVKARLDAIEARLDELQGDIRTLLSRLPEPIRSSYDQAAVLRAVVGAREPRPAAPPPPIPPASWDAEPPPAAMREALSPTLRAAARVGGAARERAEPRLRRPGV